MPRRTVDLARKIKDILQHTQPLPDNAQAPILHYQRTSAEVWGSLAYIERAINEGERYQSVVDRHLGRLHGMALVTMVETLERFLKEAAAECVNCLAPYIIDDRFNTFNIQGSSLASHFNTGSVGRSLCESLTWLNCEEINDRFRKLLADPFVPGNFQLFPKQTTGKTPSWFETMSLVWQIRNTSVHNVGVITQSDAVKLRLWAKEAVQSPCVLAPTRADLRYLKQFLDERADECNQRIGDRLAELLTAIHTRTPTLLEPQPMADRISNLFQRSLTVANVAGVLPP